MPELEETGEGQIEGSKESGDLREDSRLREEDTPESFEERLHELYPGEDQKAYITALMHISQAIVYAQCYSDESVEVRRMYTKDEEGTLYMLQEYSDNLKSVCNIAWYYLNMRGDNWEEEKLRDDTEILSKKKVLENSALDISIKELTEPTEEEIDFAKKKILAEYLRLPIPDASEALKYISLLCDGPIDSDELFELFMTIVPASHKMGVYHIEYTDFEKVYRRALRKEAETSKT